MMSEMDGSDRKGWIAARITQGILRHEDPNRVFAELVDHSMGKDWQAGLEVVPKPKHVPTQAELERRTAMSSTWTTFTTQAAPLITITGAPMAVRTGPPLPWWVQVRMAYWDRESIHHDMIGLMG